MKTKNILVAPLLSCLFASAHAATVTYNFDTVFSDQSTTPAGNAPWLTMSTIDTGAKQVSLTFTANDLPAAEHVTYWYFNVNPTLDLGQLTFSAPSKTGTFEILNFSQGPSNTHIADGSGLYDIHVVFSGSNTGGGVERFTDDDSLTYTVSYSGPESFDSSSFSFLSTPNDQTTYGPYFTAARILSIDSITPGVDEAGSAWVSAIPEPSLAIYSVLALGLSVGLRRRR